MKWLEKIIGDPMAKEVKIFAARVNKISELEKDLAALSDEKLKNTTLSLKERYEKGESLDSLLEPAFALVREASKRSIGLRHFDVQLIGGMVLHSGKIAEMRTGEGKTLVATAPVYLNALTGKGVHVVTVNDYLARRDAGWMGPVYDSIGLTIGVIIHEQAYLFDREYVDPDHEDERLKHLKPVSRKEAYEADITFGTNNEFGFDYLRDNMVDEEAKMVQRPLHFAIVDEVDSILIDEARTPLIISAPAEESTDKYYQFAKLASGLVENRDYTVDEKLKAVSLTDEGITSIEKILGVENIYEAGRVDDVHHVEQSLKAHALFKKDRDYVVREDEIIIVDEFTGRLMHGRRYSEGLHQAIEAKEGVRIRQESLTLATISFQNYFRLYQKLAGMTGTAATEAEEFHKIYNLDVATIPTHMPMVRQDMADRVYKTEAGKFRAVAAEVKERNAKGQPVLLGTVSIEKNERLSEILNEYKVPHQILNAKNNEAEAAIIAAAGKKGAVTLATNIAGRGTDIVLEDGVAGLGGLHVIGTERHESRRIDNQLRGRSGRQGDPGSTQFYVSLEDDLMRIFGSERVASLMTSLGIDDDTPIENAIVSKSIEGAQKKVEGHNFDVRKQLVEYDDVMNKHREVIYARRKQILANANLEPDIKQMLITEFEAIVRAHTDVKTSELEPEKIVDAAAGIMPIPQELATKIKKSHSSEITKLLSDQAEATYSERVKEFGEEGMRMVEKLTYLRVLDNLWIEHLEAMDSLRSGIGLRAVGQRDPLVEYKSEGFRMFKNLLAVMEAEIASTIFKVGIVKQEAPVETVLTKAAEKAELMTPAVTEDEPVVKPRTQPGASSKTTHKVGRNDPCPCGSGLKYKKCGLINAPQHQS